MWDNDVLLLHGASVLLPLISFLRGYSIVLYYCDFVFIYTINPIWDLVGIN